jgi:thiamine pyrophosphate-dependent acetolactate synthase large subunit-like protein
MVKDLQEKFYNNQLIGVKMHNPPFEDVCKALGCKSMRIDSRTNLQVQLKEFLNYSKEPIVANVITDQNETILSMVLPGRALDDMLTA